MSRMRLAGVALALSLNLQATPTAQAAPTVQAAQTVQMDTVVVSLAEAERRALQSSPSLESALASLELSRAKRTQVGHARFLPEVKLRNVWGPAPKLRAEFTETGVLVSPDTLTGLGDLTWFTQVDLNLVQPLYTFGKLSASMDAVAAQVEVSRADLERTRSEIVMQVRQLYWGVVLSRELEGLSSGMNERVAEAEDRLKELYDEGSASQNDMFKFELFKYEVSSQSRALVAGRTKAVSALRALIGIPSGAAFRVESESLEALEVNLDSLPAYLAQALVARPEVSQLESGLTARRALVRGAEAASRPSLFLAGRYSLNRAPGRFDSRNPFVRNPTNFSRPSLLLGLEWNLNFRQTGDRARVERLEVARLEARARPLMLMVQQQVREAYLDVVRASEDVEAGRAALRASENLLRAELQTFDLGIGDIEDVINAFKSNVGMAVEQFRNIATLNSKLAELSQRVGRDIG
jgi:outer membrane protein TolC